MKKQIISFTLVAAGFLIGATALSALASGTGTWTPPSATPPNGNVAAPINVGNSSDNPPVLQTRSDPLQINGNFGIAGNFMYNPGGTITPGVSVLTASTVNGDAVWATPAGSSGVTSIIAGTNISVSPSGGTGNVTINTPTPTATVNIGSGVWIYFAGNTNYSLSCPPNEIQIGYSQTSSQTEIKCATITVSMTN